MYLLRRDFLIMCLNTIHSLISNELLDAKDDCGINCLTSATGTSYSLTEYYTQDTVLRCVEDMYFDPDEILAFLKTYQSDEVN